MSLILIPLDTGTCTLDRLLDGVRDLATRVSVGGGREPLWVVPPCSRATASPDTTALESMGCWLAHQPQEESSVEGRIERALRAALAYSASVHQGARQKGKAVRKNRSSLVVVVPLVLLPVGMEGSEGLGQAERTLRAGMAALDHAARSLARKSFGRAALVGQPFRVFPWCFSPELPDELPTGLFEGCGGLVAPVVEPILCGGHSAGGGVAEWDRHGRVRLLHDMLALLALSARPDRFAHRFPVPAQGQRAFFTTHSALVEAPFGSIIERSLLRLLKPCDREQPGLLPQAAQLGELGEQQKHEIAQDLDDWLGNLQEVIEQDVLREDELDLSGRPRSPGGVVAGQASVDFTLRSAVALEAGISSARRADRIHRRVCEALDRHAEKSLPTKMAEGLEAAHATIASQREALAGQLAQASDWKGADDDPRLSTGRVVAWLDGAKRGLEAIGEQLRAEQPEPPEAILESARSLRESWIGAEQRLLERGAALPSDATVITEIAVVAVGFGVFLTALAVLICRAQLWPSPLGVAVATLLALAMGFWRWWSAVQLRRAHEQAWEQLERRLEGEANALARRMVTTINRRVAFVKFSAARDLQNTVMLIRRRVVTEVAGTGSLVDARLSLLEELAEREQERTEDEHACFALGLDEPVRALLRAKDWHTAYRNLLLPVLGTKGVTTRLFVRQHGDLLSSLVEKQQQRNSGAWSVLKKRLSPLWDRATGFAGAPAWVAAPPAGWQHEPAWGLEVIGARLAGAIEAAPPQSQIERLSEQGTDPVIPTEVALRWTVVRSNPMEVV